MCDCNNISLFLPNTCFITEVQIKIIPKVFDGSLAWNLHRIQISLSWPKYVHSLSWVKCNVVLSSECLTCINQKCSPHTVGLSHRLHSPNLHRSDDQYGGQSLCVQCVSISHQNIYKEASGTVHPPAWPNFPWVWGRTKHYSIAYTQIACYMIQTTVI